VSRGRLGELRRSSVGGGPGWVVRQARLRGEKTGGGAQPGLRRIETVGTQREGEVGMTTLAEACGSAVAFRYRSIDRPIVNAYIPTLQMPGAMVTFLHRCRASRFSHPWCSRR